jgi:hypothetical protein
MSEEGYIKLSRRFFEHDFWVKKSEFDLADAWLDLIQMAAWKDRRKLVKYDYIDEPRGGVVASVRFLCQRWGWSNTKVLNFLGLLERDTMITTQKIQGITVISLCNFEKYNTQKRQESDAGATAERRGSDKIEEGLSNCPHSIATGIPVLDEVLRFAKTLHPPCDPDYATRWFEEQERRGWIDKDGNKIHKWKPGLSAWWRAVQHSRHERAANRTHAPNGQGKRSRIRPEDDKPIFEP